MEIIKDGILNEPLARTQTVGSFTKYRRNDPGGKVSFDLLENHGSSTELYESGDVILRDALDIFGGEYYVAKFPRDLIEAEENRYGSDLIIKYQLNVKFDGGWPWYIRLSWITDEFDSFNTIDIPVENRLSLPNNINSDENNIFKSVDGEVIFLEEGVFLSDLPGLQTWYKDEDGDNFGNVNLSIFSLSQPLGYVNNSGDCDDSNNLIYPNSPEICDGIDNQCPGNRGYGSIDGGNVCNTTQCIDTDADGYYSEVGCGTASDCNDGDDSIYPGAPELCDVKDNQCAGDVGFGSIDEGSVCGILPNIINEFVGTYEGAITIYSVRSDSVRSGGDPSFIGDHQFSITISNPQEILEGTYKFEFTSQRIVSNQTFGSDIGIGSSFHISLGSPNPYEPDGLINAAHVMSVNSSGPDSSVLMNGMMIGDSFMEIGYSENYNGGIYVGRGMLIKK